MYFFEQTIYDRHANTNMKSVNQPEKVDNKYNANVDANGNVIDPNVSYVDPNARPVDPNVDPNIANANADPNVDPNASVDPNAVDPNIDPNEFGQVAVNPASTSIKRYFLIKKLFMLNEKLNKLNMKNDILNFLINFIDGFSYEALLSIARKLVEEIHVQLQIPDQADTSPN